MYVYTTYYMKKIILGVIYRKCKSLPYRKKVIDIFHFGIKNCQRNSKC